MAPKVWAVGMMRDEADVARHVIEHLDAEAVSGIIVADNRSTDGTLGELQAAKRDANCPVVILEDPDVGYYQSRKMTSLAAQAASMGADWIIPFDADEIWVAPDRLGIFIADSPADIVTAEILNHFATALDGTDPVPFRAMTYRHRDAAPLVKVAFRWHDSVVVHQGNHGVTYSDHTPIVANGLQVRHFPYRSREQFARKARNGAEAYKATDLPESEGAHWRQYGELLDRYGPHALDEVWDRWYWFLSPTDAGMVYDPAPFLRWEE